MFTLRTVHVFLYLLASFVILRVSAVTFVNPRTSFLQFKKWNASEIGGLRFRFKTFLPDALLLYMDDQGKTDFVRVDLFQGRLRLMCCHESKLGAMAVTIGENLNDLNWHRVSLERHNGNATISLDGRSKTVFTKRRLTIESPMYFGGIPPNLGANRVTEPAVRNLERFAGCMEGIETLEYSRKVRARKAMLIKSSGVTSGCIDMCARENPCKNNGECLNRFVTVECDCTGTGYKGPACNQALPVIGLGQSDYVLYNRSYKSIATQQDRITLRFKTSKPNGLLLESGRDGDYMLLELKNGSLVLGWNLGSGDIDIDLRQKACNDDKWHSIVITRKQRHLFLTFDGVLRLSKFFPGRFVAFNLDKGEGDVFVGGMSQTDFSFNSRSSGINFEGCLQEVVFNGVDIIQGLRSRDKRFLAGGRPSSSCWNLKGQAAYVTPPPSKPNILSTPQYIEVTSSSSKIHFITKKPPITYQTSRRSFRVSASPRFSGDGPMPCSDDEDDCDTEYTSGEDGGHSGSRNQSRENVSSGSGENEVPDEVSNRSSKKPTKVVPSRSSSGRPTEGEHDGEPDISRTLCLHDDEDQCDDIIDESGQGSADGSSAGSASPSTRPSVNHVQNNPGSRNKVKRKRGANKWPLVAGIIVVSVLLVAFCVFVLWWFLKHRKKVLARYKTNLEGLERDSPADSVEA